MSTPQRSRWLTWGGENNSGVTGGGTARTVKSPQADTFGSFDSDAPKASQYISPVEPDTRLTPADCLELLTETHAEILGEYIKGAWPWALATLPYLVRRLQNSESRIDDLAKVPGGPMEATFRAALAAHAAVWREIIARYRAHRERQAEKADPMPELPDDTVVAVGISYGDGELGTWDVVRQGRRR